MAWRQAVQLCTLYSYTSLLLELSGEGRALTGHFLGHHLLCIVVYVANSDVRGSGPVREARKKQKKNHGVTACTF